MLEDPPTSAVIALFEQARSGDASALANVFPLVYTELHQLAYMCLVRRSFGGLTEGKTTEALGIGLRTAKRDWAKAKLWLRREIALGSRERIRH